MINGESDIYIYIFIQMNKTLVGILFITIYIQKMLKLLYPRQNHILIDLRYTLK